MSTIRKTLVALATAAAALVAPLAAAPQAEAAWTATGKCDPAKPGVHCSMDQARYIYSTSSVTYGATNVYVYRLQKSLTWIGMPVKWTGYYGPATKQAVMNYQITRKLPATGMADAKTLEYLRVGAGQYAKLPAATRPSPGVSGSCGASYYSEGQQTASGERFNPYALTAAHKTLPFGTKLRVTNKATGKSVVVRINDRGPYITGRCLDLSLAAFRAISPVSAGVATVNYVQA